jgi:hypothetical protein
MYALSQKNGAVLLTAAAIIIVSLIFPTSGQILKLGSIFGLSAFFVAKGASSLPCRNSDVALGIGVLGLIIASKIPGLTNSPLILEICAILLTLVFAITGLTFKAIAVEQKRRRHSSDKPQ